MNHYPLIDKSLIDYFDFLDELKINYMEREHRKLLSLAKERDRINFHVKDSGKFIGYAYVEVDGYYVFVFDGKSDGAWSDYALLEIGNELKELNKEWDKEIRNALKK